MKFENEIKLMYHYETGIKYYDVRPCSYKYWEQNPKSQIGTSSLYY